MQCPSENSGNNFIIGSLVDLILPSIDYKIGRTMFETNTIPSGWVQRLNYMDEIWVPTEFAFKIFEENGVPGEKLRIFEEAVDTNFFSYISRSSIRDNLSNIQLPADLRRLQNIGNES